MSVPGHPDFFIPPPPLPPSVSSILDDDKGGVLPVAGSDEKVSCLCNQALLILNSFFIERMD